MIITKLNSEQQKHLLNFKKNDSNDGVNQYVFVVRSERDLYFYKKFFDKLNLRWKNSIEDKIVNPVDHVDVIDSVVNSIYNLDLPGFILKVNSINEAQVFYTTSILNDENIDVDIAKENRLKVLDIYSKDTQKYIEEFLKTFEPIWYKKRYRLFHFTVKRKEDLKFIKILFEKLKIRTFIKKGLTNPLTNELYLLDIYRNFELNDFHIFNIIIDENKLEVSIYDMVTISKERLESGVKNFKILKEKIYQNDKKILKLKTL
jgi:hypothetical protein